MSLSYDICKVCCWILGTWFNIGQYRDLENVNFYYYIFVFHFNIHNLICCKKFKETEISRFFFLKNILISCGGLGQYIKA